MRSDNLASLMTVQGHELPRHSLVGEAASARHAIDA